MKIKLIVLICFSLFPFLVVKGQGVYGKKIKSAFPEPMQYKQSGWYFGPGATYTLTPGSQTDSLANTEIKTNPSGRLGAFAEFGRYHLLEYVYLFRYLDYGVAYKWLRGKEEVEVNGMQIGTNSFSDHFASLHFNLNNVIEVADYTFIQNTIGINGDFLFLSNQKAGIPEVNLQSPGSIIAQLHYKLGIGIKASKNLILVPSLETPILNIFPFENGKSTLGYFNSRYRPILFSLRFIFLREIRLKSCKPVRNPDIPGGSVIPDGMEH